MTQFIKRKQKAVIKFKIDELDADETTIKLSNINPALLDKKYNMKEVKNIMEKDLVEFSQMSDNQKKKKVYKKSDIDKLQTDLENLGISDNKPKNYDTIVSNNMKIKAYSCFKEEFLNCEIPSTTNIFCWWCRHSVPKEVHPLGLPIRYSKDYFDTEGIFCSFNCMCSYLHDNLNNNLYKDSSTLIYLMYKSIFGEFPIKMNLKKAPSWKLLKQYGGSLTIEEFREMFNTVSNLTQNIEFNESSPKGKLPIKPVKLTYLE